MRFGKILVVCGLLLFMVPDLSIGQDFSDYKKEILVARSDTIPYRILFPKNFNKRNQYPLIIFLHGSGERGKDNELQLTHGAELFLREEIRNEFPAIVVFPQCPETKSWNNTDYTDVGGYQVIFPSSIEFNQQQNLLEDLLQHLVALYPVDEDRQYIGGLSMGGMGTLELLRRNPNSFAAAFSICGGAHKMAAAPLSKTPIWLFHGDADTVIPSSGSMDLYAALKEFNADVKMTIYHKVGHDSWTKAFEEPELLPWLFSKRN